MNRYQFIGNLGGDAQVRTLESGAITINFNVAITERWTDKNGEKKENTTWANCTIWKQAGQSTKIAEFLKKGTKVLIEGKPSARAYVNKENQAAASLEVRVDNLELLSALPANGQATASAPMATHTPQAAYSAARPAAPAPAPAYDPNVSDDLPF